MNGIISVLVAAFSILVFGTVQSNPSAKYVLGTGMFVSGLAAGMQSATVMRRLSESEKD